MKSCLSIIGLICVLIIGAVVFMAVSSSATKSADDEVDSRVTGTTSIKRILRMNYANARLMAVSHVMRVGSRPCKRARYATGNNAVHEVIVFLEGHSVTEIISAKDFMDTVRNNSRQVTPEAKQRLLVEAQAVINAPLYEP